MYVYVREKLHACRVYIHHIHIIVCVHFHLRENSISQLRTHTVNPFRAIAYAILCTLYPTNPHSTLQIYVRTKIATKVIYVYSQSTHTHSFVTFIDFCCFALQQ